MESKKINSLLEELVSLPFETEWVEFKVNNFEPEQISRLISALSNTAGIREKEAGYLVFGVNDKTHKIEGTTLNPKSEKIGEDLVEHWLIQRITPRINIQIFEAKQDEKRVVIIEIPAAKDRPTLASNTAYIRIGSITRELVDFPDLERIIWNNPLYRKFETESAISGLSSSEVLGLLNIDSFFRLRNLPRLTDDEEIIDLLESEKLISYNRGAYNITNLGAILFAKKLSSFDVIKRKSIRIIMYSGKDRTKTIEEKIGQIGYAAAFQGIVSFINSKLPVNEEIQESLRVERKVYPEIAIRELVANALIHQDFNITGSGPMIEIFSDRLEIYNPGNPLVNTERFIDYPPRSRNEILASLMRRVNICEERGSGIDKVISAVEIYQLPGPKFENYDNGTKVILYAPKTFRQMDREDRIRACYQHCCLNYVSNNETTNASVRKRFNISDKNYPMASRIIGDTVDANLIKPMLDETGKKKLTKYIPFWA